MTKRRTWLAALLFLLLVFAGALAWLFTADLGRFQPQLVAALGERLGRTVSVDPGLSIRLGRQVRIKASGLRVANAPWASRPQLLELASLDLTLDLYSLWRGPLVITSLEATGLRLWPQRSADGISNLDLSPGIAPAGGTTARTLPLMQHVALHDLLIEWQGRPADAPLAIVIESLSQELQPDGLLDLQATGAINGQPANYQGSLGSLQALLDGKDIHYHGKGQFGAVLFEAQGSLDDVAMPRYPEFDLHLSGNDFVPVARLLGREAADQESYRGPFSIHAVTQREGESLQLQLEGSIGELAIHATGRCAAITDFSQAEFNIRAAGPDLGAFSSLIGLGEWPRQAFQVEGGVSRQGAQFEISDTLLQVGDTHFEVVASLPRFPSWRGGTGRVDINGPDVAAFRALLGFDGPAQGEFAVHLALSQDSSGGDRLEASAHTSLLDISLSGSVGDGPGLQGSRLQGRAQGADAGQLLNTYGLPGYVGQPISLTADFEVQHEGLLLAPGTTLVLGDDRLELSGPLGFELFGGGTRLDFKTSGKDLAQFAPMLRQGTVLPGQPYAAEGELQLTQGALLLHRLRGTVGRNQLEANGRIPLSEGLRGTDLQFKASGPSLATLLADKPDYKLPTGAFEVSGRFDYQPDALRFEGLKAQVGELRAQAELSLKLPLSTASGPFDLRLSGPDPNALWPESLAYQPRAQRFELALKGAVKKGVWTFKQARLDVGEAQFSLSGSFDQFPDFSQTRLELGGHVPDYATLGTLSGRELSGGLVDFSARFSGSRHQFRIDDLTVQADRSDIKGWLKADFESAVPTLDWYSRSRLVDLSDARRRLPEKTGGKAPKPRVNDKGLPFPDLQFPMAALARFNASVDIGMDELRLPSRSYTSVEVDAAVRDGGLTVSRLRGKGLRGFLDVSLSLLPAADGAADFTLDVAADGLVLNLSRDLGVDPASLPVIEYTAKVTGHGRGLHEAAASLDGEIHTTASAGVIPNSVLSGLDAGLLEQVGKAVFPGQSSGSTSRVECLAARLEARQGLLSTAPLIALVTDKVQMVSSGTVNLANGKLDLTFESHPNKAYKANVSEFLVNPFVKFSGTLAKPKVSLDAPKALLYGGIAFGTGGLSILAKGLMDRVRLDSSPCEEFLEETRDAKNRR